MRNAFLAFNDKALALGIQDGSPRLAEQLRITVNRLDELAKSKAIDSNVEEEEQDQLLEAESRDLGETRAQLRQTKDSSGSTRVPAFGYSGIIHEEADDDDGETAQKAPVTQTLFEDSSSSNWISTEIMQQHQTTTPITNEAAFGPAQGLESLSATSSDAHDSLIFDTMNPAEQSTQELPFGLVPLSRKDRSVTDLSSVSKSSGLLSLPSPKSYAFQEASFTRRLLRTTLETGYRIMTDPTSRPEDLQRLCKFTRCFVTDPRITNHLKAMIRGSTSDSLEWEEAPVKHVGGAGLHYPMNRAHTESLLPNGCAADARSGPLPPLQAETPMPDCTTIAQIVDRVECDGEWFDPSDVEQYLRSKGLHLDGQSSIVELDEDKTLPVSVDTQGPPENSPDASSHISTVGPQSPQDADMDWLGDHFVHHDDCLGNEYTIDASELPELGVGLPAGDDNAFYQKNAIPSSDVQTFSNDVPNLNTKIQKFFDVEKFVHSRYLITLIGLMERLTHM